jgi:hypothetical protein
LPYSFKSLTALSMEAANGKLCVCVCVFWGWGGSCGRHDARSRSAAISSAQVSLEVRFCQIWMDCPGDLGMNAWCPATWPVITVDLVMKCYIHFTTYLVPLQSVNGFRFLNPLLLHDFQV